MWQRRTLEIIILPSNKIVATLLVKKFQLMSCFNLCARCLLLRNHLNHRSPLHESGHFNPCIWSFCRSNTLDRRGVILPPSTSEMAPELPDCQVYFVKEGPIGRHQFKEGTGTEPCEVTYVSWYRRTRGPLEQHVTLLPVQSNMQILRPQKAGTFAARCTEKIRPTDHHTDRHP